jgi:hypothetical protein
MRFRRFPSLKAEKSHVDITHTPLLANFKINNLLKIKQVIVITGKMGLSYPSRIMMQISMKQLLKGFYLINVKMSYGILLLFPMINFLKWD